MVQERLLTVNKLRTEFFQSKKSSVTAINEISFHLDKGEILGLVGESGCGKSVTSLSIMRLLNFTSGKVTKGEVIFDGEDLQKISENEMRKIRGGKMSMIFQDSMTSLNPIITIGQQITSIILKHQHCSEAEARIRAMELMKKVGIPNAENRFDDYPFQYSGGMRQRIVIAIALSCQPKILICDEPTTALDVTIQAQILKLIKDLQKEFGYTIVFITIWAWLPTLRTVWLCCMPVRSWSWAPWRTFSTIPGTPTPGPCSPACLSWPSGIRSSIPLPARLRLCTIRSWATPSRPGIPTA